MSLARWLCVLACVSMFSCAPMQARRLMVAGDRALQRDDPKEAATLYLASQRASQRERHQRRIEERRRYLIRYLDERSRLARLQDRPGDALEDLALLVWLDPQNGAWVRAKAEVHVERASSRMEEARWDLAREDIEEALSTSPRHANVAEWEVLLARTECMQHVVAARDAPEASEARLKTYRRALAPECPEAVTEFEQAKRSLFDRQLDRFEAASSARDYPEAHDALSILQRQQAPASLTSALRARLEETLLQRIEQETERGNWRGCLEHVSYSDAWFGRGDDGSGQADAERACADLVIARANDLAGKGSEVAAYELTREALTLYDDDRLAARVTSARTSWAARIDEEVQRLLEEKKLGMAYLRALTARRVGGSGHGERREEIRAMLPRPVSPSMEVTWRGAPDRLIVEGIKPASLGASAATAGKAVPMIEATITVSPHAFEQSETGFTRNIDVSYVSGQRTIPNPRFTRLTETRARTRDTILTLEGQVATTRANVQEAARGRVEIAREARAAATSFADTRIEAMTCARDVGERGGEGGQRCQHAFDQLTRRLERMRRCVEEIPGGEAFCETESVERWRVETRAWGQCVRTGQDAPDDAEVDRCEVELRQVGDAYSDHLDLLELARTSARREAEDSASLQALGEQLEEQRAKLVQLDEALRATPETLEEDVIREEVVLARTFVRRVTLAATLDLSTRGGKPGRYAFNVTRETTDETHPGHGRAGLKPDPLRFPTSDEALARQAREELLASLRRPLCESVRAAHEEIIAEHLARSEDERSLQVLLGYVVAPPRCGPSTPTLSRVHRALSDMSGLAPSAFEE